MDQVLPGKLRLDERAGLAGARRDQVAPLRVLGREHQVGEALRVVQLDVLAFEQVEPDQVLRPRIPRLGQLLQRDQRLGLLACLVQPARRLERCFRCGRERCCGVGCRRRRRFSREKRSRLRRARASANSAIRIVVACCIVVPCVRVPACGPPARARACRRRRIPVHRPPARRARCAMRAIRTAPRPRPGNAPWPRPRRWGWSRGSLP